MKSAGQDFLATHMQCNHPHGASSPYSLSTLFIQGLGSVAFQSFHQRTLSASSSQTAQFTCYAAALVISILGIPPILVGAVAASTGEC